MSVDPGKELLCKSNSDPGTTEGNVAQMAKEDGFVTRKFRLQRSVSGQGHTITHARKCALTLDGYSYVIVANAPKIPDVEGNVSDQVENRPISSQTFGGESLLTIVRRASIKKKNSLQMEGQQYHKFNLATNKEALDSLSLLTENLPTIDAMEACDQAAVRLRCLLKELQKGEISLELLQSNLRFSIHVLETFLKSENKKLGDEEDELSEVQPDAVPPEVRDWLASTFTRRLGSNAGQKQADEKPKFRTVAHAIRAGIFVDRMYRKVNVVSSMKIPADVSRVLKNLDDWSFDVFDLNETAANQPLKYISYDLFNRYGIFRKFKISPCVAECLLDKIEEGYSKFQNPYHNNLHAADVTQSMHYMLYQTGFANWLTDLEIFAALVAAIIHDYEHTGTTNNFHIMSCSETALLYNDRAVQENHHLSSAFRLMREDECNILQNLTREEYMEFRTLVIDMVLATDMSFHFQQLKNMKTLLSLGEPLVDKSKALSLVLHCCDISHPSKKWDLHYRWTSRLLEEFFRQGDKERELGLPFSPLCDRNNTLVAESQIGFIDFIVDPSMSVCGDMLEAIVPTLSSQGQTAEEQNFHQKIPKPWIECLFDNKRRWKDQAISAQESENDYKTMEGGS